MRTKQLLNTGAVNVASLMVIIVMVGWLLIIGRDLLIPLILALVIWYLLDTVARFLQSPPIGNISVPYPIALIGAFLVMVVFGVLVANMVAQNAAELSIQAATYEQNITKKMQGLLSMVAPNIQFSFDKLNDLLNVQRLVAWTTSLIGSVISASVLIIIYLLFLFMEQQVFDRKFNALFIDQNRRQSANKIRHEIMGKIRVYLSVKVFVSIMTGVFSSVFLGLIGLDYAVFWGFIIFLLNFIPTIGSLLGVVFPAILALVQFDTSWQFFFVTILLGSVQFSIGNIVEPRLMGSSLNLSGLVIMLALALWGAIWGITGMILSVPITVVIMIICAQFPSTYPIAVMLSSDGRVAALND